MHPRIPSAFLAPRARCWLMVTLSSSSTPSPSPQSCSPAGLPQPVLVHGVVPPQVQDPALALVELFCLLGSFPVLPRQHAGSPRGQPGKPGQQASCEVWVPQPSSPHGTGCLRTLLLPSARAGQRAEKIDDDAVLAGILGGCGNWADWGAGNAPVVSWTTLLCGCSPSREMLCYSRDGQGIE